MKKLITRVAVCLALLVSVVGCGDRTQNRHIVRVPTDVQSLQEAADAVSEDGLIIIEPGTYTESMELHTAGVTVRGADRNLVVIDGEGTRSSGIVATGAGVTIENLTVRNHLLNGVLMTGMTDQEGKGIGNGSSGYDRLDPEKFPPVSGFAIRNITVTGNGLYGIYAFNRTNGLIENNYASGSADSGIYVGQCRECATLVTNNVMELNAIGLEMANASETYVLANRLANNRIGASIQSNYQEALVPQTDLYFLGNVVVDNNEALTPEAAEGGFGIGVGLGGVQNSLVLRNLIAGNSTFGIGITSSQDIPSESIRVVENATESNGIDIAVWSTAQSDLGPNCIEIGSKTSTWPEKLPNALMCDGSERVVQLQSPEQSEGPEGISFLEVTTPDPQESLSFENITVGFGPYSGPSFPEIVTVELPDRSHLSRGSQR